ncbi:unnamed protein product [Closterium sp. Naga37s-1]|nr:unnamed protein product [Closterium sp. Naga37s-1]
MAITGENSCGDDDDDALYAATEMLEARTGLDFLVSVLSHEKEKPGPVASVANTGEASGLCRGDDRPQPAHTAKPAVPSAAGPSVRLPSRASSSKPPPRYKQAVLRWADPTDPGRPLADAGESVTVASVARVGWARCNRSSDPSLQAACRDEQASVGHQLPEADASSGWDARLSDLMCMALLPYEPDWAEVVKIWRAYKKRKPITTVAAPKKQPSAKGKEKVDEDDAGGAGSGWGTETPVHRHGSMSDGGGSDEDEDMCVM